ncbi:unnamed protein product [Rotaria sordida]|uniref:Hydantoinase n=1 Tax=Rotaria sordida TaxID=392033 RepID=A0A818X353_9BILA|nr:unnamed protein product [Rotaria sordida]
MVGTTHFVNALLQRQGLAKVCTLRLCGPATHAIPPMTNWPQDLKDAVNGLTAFVSGGFFLDGSIITPLDEDKIRSLVRRALTLDISSFCVCGVFSPCQKDQEERVAEIIHEESSTAYITLSHEIAGLGLSERENASILNASLRPLAIRTIRALQGNLPRRIPLFLTKNDGTLLSAEDSMRWPVFTFASGPTNSMIGAAYLSGIDNGIVIDVGGTSMDIGFIVNGRPRQTQANVRLIDDIRVNVSVPDIVSLPLGGGTIIHVNENDGSIRVGPNSVGYRLDQAALAFGGQTITATDIALAAGLTSGIGHSTVKLSSSIVEQVLDYIKQSTTRNIDRVKTNEESVPVILCGGGSILIDINQAFAGVTEIIRPAHYAVCNAVGAALCSISATIDSIVDLLPSSIDGGDQRKNLVAAVGFMGAPTVSHELLPNGYECLLAVNAVEKYLLKNISAIYTGEIGGSNGLMGLLVAASKQVPCIDADGVGRAFPRLDQTLALIQGCCPTPACLCDVRGETVMCTDATISTAQQLEDTFREECTKRGLFVGVCLPPITGEELQKYVFPYSLSRAWFLGEAKFNHRSDAIQAVARAGHGRVLVSDGKVISVERHTAAGFARGHLTIETVGRNLVIDFQNENLIARFDDGEILATVPDLITLVEQDSAEPVSTETIKYGYRVSVLVLPAPEAMTTPRALETVGIKAFGYDLPNYEYIPSHAPINSVWDVFYKKDIDV